jgi:hypothetical protein
MRQIAKTEDLAVAEKEAFYRPFAANHSTAENPIWVGNLFSWNTRASPCPLMISTVARVQFAGPRRHPTARAKLVEENERCLPGAPEWQARPFRPFDGLSPEGCHRGATAFAAGFGGRDVYPPARLGISVSAIGARRFRRLLPRPGLQPVPDKDLPVLLPPNPNSPAKQSPRLHSGFVNTTSPQCGGPAKRETDTMDTFVDSSWYFYRYCGRTTTSTIRPVKVGYWFPSTNIGGITHAILPLYSRFGAKSCDLGLVSHNSPLEGSLHTGYGPRRRRLSKSHGWRSRCH